MTARQPSNRQESGKKSIPPHRSHRFSGTFSAYKEEHKKKDGIKTRKAIPKLEIRTVFNSVIRQGWFDQLRPLSSALSLVPRLFP